MSASEVLAIRRHDYAEALAAWLAEQNNIEAKFPPGEPGQRLVERFTAMWANGIEPALRTHEQGWLEDAREVVQEIDSRGRANREKMK